MVICNNSNRKLIEVERTDFEATSKTTPKLTLQNWCSRGITVPRVGPTDLAGLAPGHFPKLWAPGTAG